MNSLGLDLPAQTEIECTYRQKRRLLRKQQKPKLQLLQQLLHHLHLKLYLLPSLTRLLQHLLQLQWRNMPLSFQDVHLLLPKQTTEAPLLHPQGLRVTLPHPLRLGSCWPGSRVREGLSVLETHLLHPSGGHHKVTDQMCTSRRPSEVT